MNETIVVSGEKDVQEVRKLSRLYYWRTSARLYPLGFRPRQGYTIRAFNAEYDKQCKRWSDVEKAATAMLRDVHVKWFKEVESDK